MIPAAILCGGLATRLGPITAGIPKSLIQIAGEPFISHQLRLLREHGVEHVVLCIGHFGEQIQRFVADGARWGLEVVYSAEREQLLGTGGAIKNAVPQLGERFFVLYGDSYLDDDMAAVERAHLASGKLALMTVYLNRDEWDRSNVEFLDGRIERYSKVARTEQMHHIDWGLGVLCAEAFDEWPAGVAFDLATVYGKLLANKQLAGLEMHNRFYEIGSAEGIAATEAYLREKRGQHPSLPQRQENQP